MADLKLNVKQFGQTVPMTFSVPYSLVGNLQHGFHLPGAAGRLIEMASPQSDRAHRAAAKTIAAEVFGLTLEAWRPQT